MDLKKIHNAMAKYEDWVEEAPDSWKEDGFLTRNLPISVTHQFGQNMPLEVDRRDEQKQWQGYRDFSKLRYMCIALATDIG